MKRDTLTPEQRREIRRQMRVPVFAWGALLSCLAGVILLGALAPSRTSAIIEFALLVVMVLTVLLFTMEVRDETSLLRFFSGLGFVWVATLFTMTMLDYLTR